MTLGPVSYTVIAFPGNKFNGNIIPEIEKLVANDVVRILDLVFVMKDEKGDTISLEFDQMDELAAFGDIDGEVGGLVNDRGPRPCGRQPARGQLRAGHRVGGPLGEAAGRGTARVGWGADRQRPHPGRTSSRRRSRSWRRR